MKLLNICLGIYLWYKCNMWLCGYCLCVQECDLLVCCSLCAPQHTRTYFALHEGSAYAKHTLYEHEAASQLPAHDQHATGSIFFYRDITQYRLFSAANWNFLHFITHFCWRLLFLSPKESEREKERKKRKRDGDVESLLYFSHFPFFVIFIFD